MEEPDEKTLGERLVVYELRVNLPLTGDLPFELVPIILVDPEAMTAEQADEIEALREAISGACDPRYVRLHEVQVRADEEFSVSCVNRARESSAPDHRATMASMQLRNPECLAPSAAL